MGRLRLLAAVILVLAPTAGGAQEYGLTDQQRRRLHLPYVRAATDCLARAIATNTEALDQARAGQWYDALVAVQGVCRPVLAAMVQEHDRLYGPGTGDVFFKGPYVRDLPRALLGRLRAAFEQRATDVAKAEGERGQRIETASKVRDLLRDRMYECTSEQLIALVNSSETAEILAAAAMTLCSWEVDQTIDAGVEHARADGLALSGAELQRFRSEVRDLIRRNVVANAVQTRATAKLLDQSPTEKVVAKPAQVNPPVAAGIRTVEDCLKATSGIRDGRLVDQEKLIATMIDLCRPEIESVARSSYLSDPSTPLEEARKRAAAAALAQAKQIVGAP